jgi:hypothetical protein
LVCGTCKDEIAQIQWTPNNVNHTSHIRNTRGTCTCPNDKPHKVKDSTTGTIVECIHCEAPTDQFNLEDGKCFGACPSGQHWKYSSKTNPTGGCECPAEKPNFIKEGNDDPICDKCSDRSDGKIQFVLHDNNVEKNENKDDRQQLIGICDCPDEKPYFNGKICVACNEEGHEWYSELKLCGKTCNNNKKLIQKSILDCPGAPCDRNILQTTVNSENKDKKAIGSAKELHECQRCEQFIQKGEKIRTNEYLVCDCPQGEHLIEGAEDTFACGICEEPTTKFQIRKVDGKDDDEVCYCFSYS